MDAAPKKVRLFFLLTYLNFCSFLVTEMLGAEGPEIIYCGDHLYADVVRQETHYSMALLS
jgi:hypothetical protein